MKSRINNSIKDKLLLYFLISIGFTFISFGLLFLSFLHLQNMTKQRFQNELYLNELQANLDAMQDPFEDYLSTFSSSSLSTLLFTSETLHEAIPENRPVYNDPQELMKREIYFLIDHYLGRINEIIEQKRGKRVSEYTEGFDELSKLYRYISLRINKVSLAGFREQLEINHNFLLLFQKVQMYSLILIFLIMLIAFSIILRSVNRMVTPIHELSIMAGKISAGDFEIPDINFNSVNEINHVAGAFNNMKNSIHHYIQELKDQKEIEQQILNERLRNMKMEQLLKRMELYTLQAQMNPHFLFNTINTGVQLAIVEEAEKTADFMENLAALFRFNIREKKFFVPLRHELDGLRSYFNILKIRFPNSLNLNLEFNEELLDLYSCPAMILQPLVENSVLHAFRSKDGIGTITVAVSYAKPMLEFLVRDNGGGMAENTVQELLKPHNHDYQLSSKVMGLENVIQRCYFFYPDEDQVISIKSQSGKGTDIIIKINTEVKPCIEL